MTRSRYYLTMELGLVQGGLSKMRADNLPFWLGDGLKVGDYPRSLVKRPKIHTRQTYQKGIGLFWHVSVGIRKCQGRGGGRTRERKEVSGLVRPLLPVPCADDTRLIDPRCKGDARPTSTTGKGSRFESPP